MKMHSLAFLGKHFIPDLMLTRIDLPEAAMLTRPRFSDGVYRGRRSRTT
jgi:hypothetical protein